MKKTSLKRIPLTYLSSRDILLILIQRLGIQQTGCSYEKIIYFTRQAVMITKAFDIFQYMDRLQSQG